MTTERTPYPRGAHVIVRDADGRLLLLRVWEDDGGAAVSVHSEEQYQRHLRGVAGLWEIGVPAESVRPLERRADGWPLCPNCGEEELWSPLTWDGEGERPAIEAYIAAGLTCYRCQWTSRR